MARLAMLFLVCASSAAAAQPLVLQVFENGQFEPGQYRVSRLDDRAASRGADAGRCIVRPETLIHTGLDAADGKSCANTIVEDTSERATVAYSCRGIGSGRTTVVMDNRSHFTVDAQGISGREPFAVRQEYKRIGDCER